MDIFGKIPLVEIPVHVTPDQKKWLDKMVEEGKIAIPPGGTLEKGSVISMFLRMLIHNAMEEQMRQAAIDAEDEEDDDEQRANEGPFQKLSISTAAGYFY